MPSSHFAGLSAKASMSRTLLLLPEWTSLGGSASGPWLGGGAPVVPHLSAAMGFSLWNTASRRPHSPKLVSEMDTEENHALLNHL